MWRRIGVLKFYEKNASKTAPVEFKRCFKKCSQISEKKK
jgi:hypothetical protein